MPYVITTTRNTGVPMNTSAEPNVYKDYVQSRRAVATLDEARDYCRELWPIAREGYVQRVVTDSGGTIGPLPDGTVIEVERVTGEYVFDELARLVGIAPAIAAHMDHDQIIDAYNAAQETP